MRRTALVLVIAGSSLALWAACCIVWISLLSLEAWWGCPGLTDDSGTADARHWSWLPPGQVCAYHVDGGTHIDEPSEARVAVAGLLLLWPAGTVALAGAAVMPAARPAPRTERAGCTP